MADYKTILYAVENDVGWITLNRPEQRNAVNAEMREELIGVLTDARTTRWGRRKPYIVGGTLFDVVFLLAMAFAGNYIVLLVAYLLLQLSSNIAHGPYQGYIPELVPEAKRGAVSAGSGGVS